MASFDIQSGAEGAQAGTAAYPGIGTVAGFVIGGFLGGAKKSKAKKKLKKKEKQLRQLMSPEWLRQQIARGLPLFRQQVQTSGEGAALGEKQATQVARAAGGNTGIGASLLAASERSGENLAFRQAGLGAMQERERLFEELTREIGSLGGNVSGLPTGTGAAFGQLFEAGKGIYDKYKKEPQPDFLPQAQSAPLFPSANPLMPSMSGGPTQNPYDTLFF